jgi:uncharacterized membrane protein
MRSHGDLRLTVAVTFICAVVAAIFPVDFIRLLFAIPLCLFLPGFAIASATTARRPIERPQLLIMSIGLSLAVLAISSLLLNYVGGLRTGPWALLLALVVLAGCMVAAIRRQYTPKEWTLELRRPPLLITLLVAVGLLATAGAVVLAFTPVEAKHVVGYTEMWMLPTAQGDATGVKVGVGNEGHARTGYGLIVHFRGRAKLGIRRLVLDPGERKVMLLPTPAPPAAGRIRVVATLYLRNRPNIPYKRVTGWIVPAGVSGG